MRLDAKLLKKTGVFAFVSGELLSLVGGGAYLGIYLDRKLGTKPVLVSLMSFLGLLYCVWRIRKASSDWTKNE